LGLIKGNYPHYEEVTEGQWGYDFKVHAQDLAGNRGAAIESQLLLVDTKPPSINILLRDDYSAYQYSRSFKGNTYQLLSGAQAGLTLYLQDKATLQTGNVGSGIASLQFDLFEITNNSTGAMVTVNELIPTFMIGVHAVSFNTVITQTLLASSLIDNLIHTSQNVGLARFSLISHDQVISASLLGQVDPVDTANVLAENLMIITLNVNHTGYFKIQMRAKDWAGNESIMNQYVYIDLTPPGILKTFSGLVYLGTDYAVYLKTVSGNQGSFQSNFNQTETRPEDDGVNSKFLSERNTFTIFPNRSQLYSDDANLGLIKGNYPHYEEVTEGQWGYDFILVTRDSYFYTRAYDQRSSELGYYQSTYKNGSKINARYLETWDSSAGAMVAAASGGTGLINLPAGGSTKVQKSNYQFYDLDSNLDMDNQMFHLPDKQNNFKHWDDARELGKLDIDQLSSGSELQLAVVDLADNITTIGFTSVYFSESIELMSQSGELKYLSDHSYNNRYTQTEPWGNYTYGVQKIGGVYLIDTQNIYLSFNVVVSSDPHSLRTHTQRPIFFSLDDAAINAYSGLNASTGTGVTAAQPTTHYSFDNRLMIKTNSNGNPSSFTPVNDTLAGKVSVNVPNRLGDKDVNFAVQYGFDSVIPEVTINTFFKYSSVAILDMAQKMGALTQIISTFNVVDAGLAPDITFVLPTAFVLAVISDNLLPYKEVLFFNTRELLLESNWITSADVEITDNVLGVLGAGLPNIPFKVRIKADQTTKNWVDGFGGVTDDLVGGVNLMDVIWLDNVSNYKGTRDVALIYDPWAPRLNSININEVWFNGARAVQSIFEQPYDSTYNITPVMPNFKFNFDEIFYVDGYQGLRLYFDLTDNVKDDSVLSANAPDMAYLRLSVKRNNGPWQVSLNFTADQLNQMVGEDYGLFDSDYNGFEIAGRKPVLSNGTLRYAFFVSSSMIISDNELFGSAIPGDDGQSNRYKFRLDAVDYAGNATRVTLSHTLEISNKVVVSILTMNIHSDVSYHPGNVSVMTQDYRGTSLSISEVYRPISFDVGSDIEKIYNDGIVSFSFNTVEESEISGLTFGLVWHQTPTLNQRYFVYQNYDAIKWVSSNGSILGSADFTFDFFQSKPRSDRDVLGSELYFTRNIPPAIITHDVTINTFIAPNSLTGYPFDETIGFWIRVTIDTTPPVLSSGLPFDLHSSNSFNDRKGLLIHDGVAAGDYPQLGDLSASNLTTYLAAKTFVFINPLLDNTISLDIGTYTDAFSDMPADNKFLRKKVYQAELTDDSNFKYTLVNTARYAPGFNSIGTNVGNGEGVYHIDFYISNRAALLTKSSVAVIKDFTQPVINAFNIADSINQDYAASNRIYFGNQEIMLSWDVQDNLALSSNANLTGGDADGIWFSQLRFENLTDTNYKGYIFSSRNARLSYDSQIEFTGAFVVTTTRQVSLNFTNDIVNFIQPGKVRFTLSIYDYALNWTNQSFEVYFDTSNVIQNSVSGFDFLQDDTDSEGDGQTPSSSASNESNIFDQSTVYFSVSINASAWDLTQLSTLTSPANPPIEVVYEESGTQYLVNSSKVQASYTNALGIDADPNNIGGTVIWATADLSDYIAVNDYQGQFKVYTRWIDGAGYLSATSNKSVIMTADLSAPIGTVAYVTNSERIFNIGDESNFNSFGITLNWAFHANRDVRVSQSFTDTHSNMSNTPYRYVVHKYDFLGNFLQSTSTNWGLNDQLSMLAAIHNINGFFISENHRYNINLLARNKAGIVQSNTLNLVFDSKTPTIHTLAVDQDVIAGAYSRSDPLFVSYAQISVNWTASDNSFVDSSGLLFNGVTAHQGIQRYRLNYDKLTGSNPGLNTLSSNIGPLIQLLTIESVIISDTIGQGKTNFQMIAQDFASNNETVNFGPYFFDWTNTLNNQLDSSLPYEPVSDDVNNVSFDADDIYGMSPVSASARRGYFDQPTIDFTIHFGEGAGDFTQFNKNRLDHLPIEVFISTANNPNFYIPTGWIVATYDHKLGIDAVFNLATYDIFVTIDLQQIIGIGIFQGPMDIQFKFVDGAGNLSPTTGQKMRITIDMTAPTGDYHFRDGYGFVGIANQFDRYGISTNVAFTSRDNLASNVRITLDYQDAHSELRNSWNRLSLSKRSLAGVYEGVEYDRDWSADATLNIFDINSSIADFITGDRLYTIANRVANQSGLVHHGPTRHIVVDHTAPVINSFNVVQKAGEVIYNASSPNFVQRVTLNFNWLVSDNVYLLNPELFASQSHQGLSKYVFEFNKPNEGSTWTVVSDNIVPTIDNQIELSTGYIVNTIQEGKILFRVRAFDFAENFSESQIGPFYLDLNNTLNEQIDATRPFEPVTANASNLLIDVDDIFDFSPFDAGGVGVYDRTTIDFIIHFKDSAFDFTQFSFLNFNHIPIEVFIETLNNQVTQISSASVFATYNQKSSIDDAPNLPSYSIAVTLDLSDIIGTTTYQGAFKLYFKFIDGAGNRSDTTNVALALTVDVSLPSGEWNFKSGVSFQGNAQSQILYGLDENYAFSNVVNPDPGLVISGDIIDIHSGLSVSWNRFILNKKDLNYVAISENARDFSNVPTYNIFDSGIVSDNHIYDIVMYASNRAGLMRKIATRNLVLDTIFPVIQTMDIVKEPLSGAYPASSANYSQVQTQNVFIVASDNMFDTLALTSFTNAGHRGIQYFDLQYRLAADTVLNTIELSIFPTINPTLKNSMGSVAAVVGGLKSKVTAKFS